MYEQDIFQEIGNPTIITIEVVFKVVFSNISKISAMSTTKKKYNP